MCLTRVYPDKKIIKEGTGYKVFSGNEEGLMPCFFWSRGGKTLGKGKWLKEGKFRAHGRNGDNKELIEGLYPFGFHLFRRKRDAKYFNRFSNHIIKKIKFRKGCAIGLNNWSYRDLETIVAKEIFIPGAST